MRTMKYEIYKAFWVVGYDLCGQQEIINVPLTPAEQARLTWRYQRGLDDPYKAFKDSESAKQWALENLKGVSGRFVRIMHYHTNNVKHAEEFCLLRDEKGNLIIDAEWPEFFSIPDSD